MSFFSLKVTCGVCGSDASMNRLRIANKEWACSKCLKIAGYNTIGPFTDKLPKDMTTVFLKHKVDRFDKSMEILNKFNPTKKVGNIMEFDDNSRQWLILSSILGKRDKSIIYNYDEISNFELLEDGETISQGGIGRALVGGALLGGTGAVVGGITGKRKNKGVCNSLRIKITLNDVIDPVVYVDLLNSKTKKSSMIYKSHYNHAQEILSILDLITKSRSSDEPNETQTHSAADEIRKFKALLDDGIITEHEFESKRNELLGT